MAESETAEPLTKERELCADLNMMGADCWNVTSRDRAQELDYVDLIGTGKAKN